MNEEIPCRLSVILAREAPIGVIFRRGPSKWVQIIKWNTDTDEFEFGQWFHGRIYADRSDLSPDGSKLLYMASKYKRIGRNSSEIWTAISKVPYLTALAHFPQTSGTWAGGGLFVSQNEIWVNAEAAPGTIFFHHERRPDTLTVNAHLTNADISSQRLERDGWKNHVKRHPVKALELRISSSSQEYDFILRDTSNQLYLPLTNASWADWDKNGRLVYAKDGKIYSGEIDAAGELASQEIADFNHQKPEPKEAPDWAKIW